MNKFLFAFAALLAVVNAGYLRGPAPTPYGKSAPVLIGHGYIPNPAATVEIIPSPVYAPAPAYGPAPSYGPAPVYRPAPVYAPAPSVAYLAAPAYGPAPISYAPVNYSRAAPQTASAASAAAAASQVRDNTIVVPAPGPSYSVPAYNTGLAPAY